MIKYTDVLGIVLSHISRRELLVVLLLSLLLNTVCIDCFVVVSLRCRLYVEHEYSYNVVDLINRFVECILLMA